MCEVYLRHCEKCPKKSVYRWTDLCPRAEHRQQDLQDNIKMAAKNGVKASNWTLYKLIRKRKEGSYKCREAMEDPRNQTGVRGHHCTKHINTCSNQESEDEAMDSRQLMAQMEEMTREMEQRKREMEQSKREMEQMTRDMATSARPMPQAEPVSTTHDRNHTVNLDSMESATLVGDEGNEGGGAYAEGDGVFAEGDGAYAEGGGAYAEGGAV